MAIVLEKEYLSAPAAAAAVAAKKIYALNL